MLIATGKIVAPTTKKAPAGKSGQSSRYPLPDSVFAENGLNFDDDALMEQVDVCDFLFEVNLQLPFVTTLNLAHALPADPELISWQSFWSYQEYCFSDPASSSAIRPDGSSNSAVASTYFSRLSSPLRNKAPKSLPLPNHTTFRTTLKGLAGGESSIYHPRSLRHIPFTWNHRVELPPPQCA